MVQSQNNQIDSLQGLVEDQKDLIANQSNKLDSLESLVEDQRDFIAQQTELIANQTDMLSTLSSMITTLHDTYTIRDCAVQCSLTGRNILDTVTYNSLELEVTGNKSNHETRKLINFNSCEKTRPGRLTIKGRYTWGDEHTDKCQYGGLMMHCQANDASNPWHDFVTDPTHWKVSDGSTPCSMSNKNGQVYGRSEAFIENMKIAGALQIWSDAR